MPIPGFAALNPGYEKGPPTWRPSILYAAGLLRRRQCRGLRGGFGPQRRLFLALGEDERVAFDGDFAGLFPQGAGAGGDEPADNDVLLKPVERVGLAVDRGLGEHARRLLERRRRDERARLQRGFGNAEQHRMRGRRLLAFGPEPGVDLVELDLVDLFALDQVGLAGVVDLDLLQHLPHDHFDVLVVDRDALEPVDVLDLVDQVAGKLLDALDRQDVVRRRVAFDDIVALLDEIAVLHVDVLALGHQILPGLLILAGRLDGDAPLVLVVAAEPHRAGNLGDDRRFLRPPRLEQLRHPRQTAGDVARFGAFGRDTGDDVAGADMHAGIDRNDGVHCQERAGVATTAELEDLAVLVLDHQCRAQVLLAAGGARAPIDDHALGDAGRLVERLGQRLTFDQVLVADDAVHPGEDRPRIRVPLGNALAALDVIAFVDLQ